MAAPLESSVVRIYSKTGKVVGAGFLVSSKHVLTCAHVVTDALGIPRTTQEQPDLVINLDFPLLAAKQLFVAKVIFWQPVNPNQKFEDIAGLELETALPDTAQPAQLVTSEDLWGHLFRVLGFPAGQPNGVSASGVLRGRIANGWVQLEDVKQPGYRLEPGFSGAPVWDEELQGVAGIAVAAEMNRAEVKAAFIIPTSILVSAWSVLREQAISSCPYRGLFAFREQDAKFFFGRETFTEQLVAAVQRQQFVAVIGSSGIGKSSVVFAGLIPKLRQEGSYLIASFSPKHRPFYRLAEALIPLLETQMSKTERLVEIKKQADALQQGNLELQDIVEGILQDNPSAQRLLLVVDQFEELYTLCQVAEDRQHFLDQLLATVRTAQQKRTPDFTLVITLRYDFLGQALSYRPFVDVLQHNDLKLGPMNSQELQEAIEKPAQKLGVMLQDGLTKIILDAVSGEPGNLPLLEFALKLLWEKQSQGKLTHAAYEEIGGVENALAKHAEAVYEKLNQGEQKRVQHIFTQLVCPGKGTEDTRRLATRADVKENNWDLVTYLADQDARLVVTGCDEVTGEATVEVVHEALIGGWERLRLWMEADRDFRTWQEQLRAVINTWEKTKQDEGALLRGALLVEAEEWIEQRADAIHSAEKEFIQASREHQKQEEQRERQLRKLAEISEIDALISLSESRLLLHDRLEALVASVKAGRKLKETEAPNAVKVRTVERLRQTVYGIQERNRFQSHRGLVTSISFSPSGQMIASASDDSTINLWSLDGTLIKTLTEHKGTVKSVSFSPDGQMIASASDDATIKLWSLDGILIKTLTEHKGTVKSVSFSPDGQMIASASDDATIKLWSLDGILIKTLTEHKGTVKSVSFSPDGQMIASACMDGTIKLWSCDGKVSKILEGHTDLVNQVSFSPDAQKIISASNDGTIRLWSREGTEVKTFQWYGNWIFSASFSPDGQIIAATGCDGTIKFWSLDGTELTTLKCHTEPVTSVSFSPDGQIVASASWDRTIKLWSRNGVSLNNLKGHSAPLSSVSFSPNGKIVASSSQDCTIKLWSQNGILLETLKGHSEAVSSLSFSPDGQIIASASSDCTIKLWSCNGVLRKTLFNSEPISSVSFSPDGQMIASAVNVVDIHGTVQFGTVKLWSCDGVLRRNLKGHNSAVSSVSFSPDGQMIASASHSGTIKLWRCNGDLLRDLEGHSNWVMSVSFSPDGQTIASASADWTIKLWRSLDGVLLKTLEGHSNWVMSVSFSPDGQTIASASADCTIKLWSLDGMLLGTLKGHDQQVSSVSFSPEGKRIASASWDKTLILWNLDLDDLLVCGCNWLRDYLKTNPNVSESDRHLCDGIGTQK